MRSVCCATRNSVLMCVYKEDTDDVLNPSSETCPASQKSFKYQCKRPGQKLSCADRPWPRVTLSEGAAGSRSRAVAPAGPGLVFSREVQMERPPRFQPGVG